MKTTARKGFTLIELIVVIAIIAVLVALVMPAFKKAAGQAGVGQVPALKGPVNDHADVLSDDEEKQLTAELLAQEKETSNQVVILTIVKLADGDTPEAYADKVFQTWKLGQKGKDNGVLILQVTESRDMRIEVGKGLEGNVTDAVAGRIIREGMTPNFKQKDFAGGFRNAIHSVNLAAKGEFNAEGGNVNFPNAAPLVAVGGAPLPIWVWIIIVIVVLAVLIWMAKNGAFDNIDWSSGGSYSSGSSDSSGGGGSHYSGGGGGSAGGGAGGKY